MKVGIAGYGVVGKTRHRSIELNTSYQVTAISECNEEAQKFIPAGLEVYNDYKSLIVSAGPGVYYLNG